MRLGSHSCVVSSVEVEWRDHGSLTVGKLNPESNCLDVKLIRSHEKSTQVRKKHEQLTFQR